MKTLTESLAQLRDIVGEPWRSLNDDVVRKLNEAKVTDAALKVGDICPDFALMNDDGRMVQLKDMLATGRPLVFCFYRGNWCPFCVAELEALHAAQDAIAKAGGTLITISSEAGGLPQSFKRERKIHYETLADLDNGLALAFGLVFRVSDALAETLLTAGTDFLMIYGNDSWFLPIPATYVVTPDAVIRYAYVNADFRYRADPEEIVEALKNCQREAV